MGSSAIGRPPKYKPGLRFGFNCEVLFNTNEVTRIDRGGPRYQRWVCKCGRCCNFFTCLSTAIGNGQKSCGCWMRRTGPDSSNYKHGQADGGNRRKGAKRQTPEYAAWSQMKQRCGNEKSFSWEYYGGIGVTVCERWSNSFEAFFNDVGKRPSSKHSLDRINPDGNYEPGNTRWATIDIQNNNKRERVPKVRYDILKNQRDVARMTASLLSLRSPV